MAPEKPALLLVHGAWHGAWAWTHLTPLLEQSSLFSTIETVDLPCCSSNPATTEADDAAAVRAALLPLIDAPNKKRRVLVLAHSYAGPVASAGIVGLSPPELLSSSASAASDSSEGGAGGGVIGLIVLCGYVYPGGLDQGALIDSLGGLDYVNWDAPTPGLFTPKDPTHLFYEPDCTPSQASWATAQLRPQSTAANRSVVPPQAWEDGNFKGQFGYVEATADNVVPLDYQRKMVEGAGGEARWTVRTLEGSGHSPMVSRPGEVVRVVGEIMEEWGTK